MLNYIQRVHSPMEHFSLQEAEGREDSSDGVPEDILRNGVETSVISRLALQQRLLQENAGDWHHQLAVQQQLQHLQQKLGNLHQQQLMQQLMQQQASTMFKLPLSSLLAQRHPAVGNGLPANQIGISGFSPFGTSLAAASILPSIHHINNSMRPPPPLGTFDAFRQNELLRAAVFGDSLQKSSDRVADSQCFAIPVSQQNSASSTTVGSVLDLYCSKGVKEPPFPLKLHQILSNPDYHDCICWLPHGNAWRILKPSEFEKTAIPHFFRHAKYASFMRQVNGWGFKRLVQGAEHNSYYHELFIRDRPELCLKMKRTGNNAKAPSRITNDGSKSRSSVLEGDNKKKKCTAIDSGDAGSSDDESSSD